MLMEMKWKGAHGRFSKPQRQTGMMLKSKQEIKTENV